MCSNGIALCLRLNVYAISMKNMTHRKCIKKNILDSPTQCTSRSPCDQIPGIKYFSISSTVGGDNSYSSDKTTHFGYRTVSEVEKRENGKNILQPNSVIVLRYF